MRAVTQFALDFPHSPSFQEADFLVSDSNREAYEWVSRWPNWPHPFLILQGPAASGKTHLCHVLAHKNQALFIPPEQLNTERALQMATASTPLIVDGLEHIESVDGLFHLLNVVKESSNSLLITSAKPLALLGFRLPDLLSRLKAAPWIPMHEPDEALLAALLAKHFADHQLRVNPDVIQYLLLRMERSFPAARHWAEYINQQALQQQKPVTIPFIRLLMNEKSPLFTDD